MTLNNISEKNNYGNSLQYNPIEFSNLVRNDVEKKQLISYYGTVSKKIISHLSMIIILNLTY